MWVCRLESIADDVRLDESELRFTGTYPDLLAGGGNRRRGVLGHDVRKKAAEMD
jgi:hypothetical protein